MMFSIEPTACHRSSPSVTRYKRHAAGIVENELCCFKVDTVLRPVDFVLGPIPFDPHANLQYSTYACVKSGGGVRQKPVHNQFHDQTKALNLRLRTSALCLGVESDALPPHPRARERQRRPPALAKPDFAAQSKNTPATPVFIGGAVEILETRVREFRLVFRQLIHALVQCFACRHAQTYLFPHNSSTVLRYRRLAAQPHPNPPPPKIRPQAVSRSKQNT